MSARLRLIKTGYHAGKQSVRGFVVDAAGLAQLAMDDLPPRGLTFDETARVRDLLVAGLELMDEQEAAKRNPDPA